MSALNQAQPATQGCTNVVLVGLMGSGKSSVGRTVAEGLGLQFADTDAMIVEEAHRPITEIFADEGEDGFRRRETRALESLAKQQNLLLSTGGGIILCERNRQLLSQLGFVVWLTASIDTLAYRVSQNRDRPLLHTEDPKQRLIDLMDVRRSLYEEVSDLTVDTTDLTLPETVHGLVESIHYHFACKS
jgi:shikimate kinase